MNILWQLSGSRCQAPSPNPMPSPVLRGKQREAHEPSPCFPGVNEKEKLLDKLLKEHTQNFNNQILTICFIYFF